MAGNVTTNGNRFYINNRMFTYNGDNTITQDYAEPGKIDFDSNELNTTAQNYITEHYDEISKVVQKEGENAALIKVFDEIAPTLYQTMTDTYKKAPTKKLTSTVTLEKKDDKWIITGLDE